MMNEAMLDVMRGTVEPAPRQATSGSAAAAETERLERSCAGAAAALTAESAARVAPIAARAAVNSAGVG